MSQQGPLPTPLTCPALTGGVFPTICLPPRLRDPHLGDRDQLAAGPNLLSREGRQPSIDQLGDQACVEAVGAQQHLRHAVAVRGREHGESTVLLGSQAHRRRTAISFRGSFTSNSLAASAIAVSASSASTVPIHFAGDYRAK